MKDPKSLGSIFQNDALKIIEGAHVVLQWDKIVEGQVAKRTRALKFERGTLFIEVTSPAWANELNFYKEEIKNKMNNRLGKKTVKDIRFLFERS